MCENALVGFNQHATPKGYKAKVCSLLDTSKVLTYVTPDEFITSRSGGVRGWEVIEAGNWNIHGSSGDSPDAARRYVAENAQRIDANALLDLEYYKTTGSSGNYNFTVHNFRGRPATLAKRNSNGKYYADALIGLNQRAETLKKVLEERLKASKKRCRRVWRIIGFLSVIALMQAP